ncbi:uncharacterized protein LOC126966641 [Leptidea sinapis]|uniref:uncharacterized protein LOC126966641 n=1 Tax=Leptidea sinapis TaxID=189913 RepID=UPI0021C2798A|nr:uncharacterized protein LOC126966641 [Leptidea sinapis]
MLRDFSICHDDFSLKPPDGILKDHTFTWLGFVQYLHVTTGLPHHGKSPRVVLIHKQFALGPAADMTRLPKNYKLGNIMFGNYERDEEDCGLTLAQTKMGAKCPRSYLEIPLIDITPHPEFSRFGVGNSLALIKLLRPVKSHYMIPVCLPAIGERQRKRRNKFVFMVDYISSVPRDFDTEKMAKRSLKMFTHKECKKQRMRSKLGSEGVTHVLCSSGCGIRPGAPIISHALEGTFQLMGIAVGGAACTRRSMRNRINKELPLFIDVYPYVNWIINFISAHILPRPYPETFMMVDGGSRMGINREYMRARRKQQSGWRARTFVVGDNCFKSLKKQSQTAFFYNENFEVNADPPGKLNVIMKFSAGIECTIVCVRLLLPNRLVTPIVHGVGGYNITVVFSTEWFPYTFYFSLGLNGRNTTQKDFLKWIGERKPGFW